MNFINNFTKNLGFILLCIKYWASTFGNFFEKYIFIIMKKKAFIKRQKKNYFIMYFPFF